MLPMVLARIMHPCERQQRPKRDCEQFPTCKLVSVNKSVMIRSWPHRKSNVNICDINDEVREAIKKFKFRKAETSAALILKVDRDSQTIRIDELIEDTTLDDLQEVLPGHQPRYVVYTCKMEHSDGRTSYPMCFIYVTPRDCQTELQIMYAGSKIALQKEVNLSHIYEVRELEELTDEWLLEKLKK